jgi:hypothetical protein
MRLLMLYRRVVEDQEDLRVTLRSQIGMLAR